MARSKPSDATAPSGKAGRDPERTRPRRSSARDGGGQGAEAGKNGEPKVGRIKQFTNQAGMIRQAYTLTRKNDPKLPWIMLIAFVAVAAVVELIGILLGSPYLFIPLAVLVGLLAALIVFGRRAQGSAVPPGRGPARCRGLGARGHARRLAGDLRRRRHRRSSTPCTGCSAGPASILVAEGAPSRVRGLLAQEKKKVARVVGDTPIYDIVVGDDEGQVPLRKLSSHVMKLPRNLTRRRGQRPRPPDERPGRRPDAGPRRPAARRQADVDQPAPGPPPRLIADLPPPRLAASAGEPARRTLSRGRRRCR